MLQPYVLFTRCYKTWVDGYGTTQRSPIGVCAVRADGSEVADGDNDGTTHGVLIPTGYSYSPAPPTLANLDGDPELELISTVNGGISLRKTLVQTDITTYNGEVTLLEGSRVLGDLRIKEGRGSKGHQSTLTIRISGGSVVEGDIIVEDDHRPVKVYLSQGGTVRGAVRGAQLIRE